MISKVFCIYDSKAEAYMNPFFQKNDAMALRSVRQAVADPNTTFHQFPMDFTLFYLGTYDDASAEFDLLTVPSIVSPLHQLPMERSTDETSPVSDGAQLQQRPESRDTSESV